VKASIILEEVQVFFRQTKIPFLGHWIGQGSIHMDPAKIIAITYWEEPHTMHDVRVFLGLANYYQIFIEGYSKIACTTNRFFEEGEILELDEKEKVCIQRVEMHNCLCPSVEATQL
jgi:hypothetical protein